MNQEPIDVFDYDEEIARLHEDWKCDMAIVFREFDEDRDGKVTGDVARHMLRLFRLSWKGRFDDAEIVRLHAFLDEASRIRDEIFLNPSRRFQYFFEMISGVGMNTMSAADIKRFIHISGDEIALRHCDDFIDEFDRSRLSKEHLTAAEFCAFCANRKVPV